MREQTCVLKTSRVDVAESVSLLDLERENVGVRVRTEIFTASESVRLRARITTTTEIYTFERALDYEHKLRLKLTSSLAFDGRKL